MNVTFQWFVSASWSTNIILFSASLCLLKELALCLIQQVKSSKHVKTSDQEYFALIIMLHWFYIQNLKVLPVTTSGTDPQTYHSISVDWPYTTTASVLPLLCCTRSLSRKLLRAHVAQDRTWLKKPRVSLDQLSHWAVLSVGGSHKASFTQV